MPRIHQCARLACPEPERRHDSRSWTSLFSFLPIRFGSKGHKQETGGGQDCTCLSAFQENNRSTPVAASTKAAKNQKTATLNKGMCGISTMIDWSKTVPGDAAGICSAHLKRAGGERDSAE